MKKTIILISLFTTFLILTLNVECFTQSGQEEKKVQDTTVSVNDVQILLEKYGCLACHKTYGPKVGPAYHGVSIKYREEFAENAADSIALYIKKGSTGNYVCSQLEGSIMPPFNIPKEERMAIANWIVTLRPAKDMYRKQDDIEK